MRMGGRIAKLRVKMNTAPKRKRKQLMMCIDNLDTHGLEASSQ